MSSTMYPRYNIGRDEEEKHGYTCNACVLSDYICELLHSLLEESRCTHHVAKGASNSEFASTAEDTAEQSQPWAVYYIVCQRL